MHPIAAPLKTALRCGMKTYRKAQIPPPALRQSYLASLAEPQEWFLEELVRSGEVWTQPGQGYAVFNGDTLVEFHHSDGANAAAQLADLYRQRPFTQILGKSFDYALMQAAQDLGWTGAQTGYLFRKREAVSLISPAQFELRRATASDLPYAWEIGQDFYDSPDELEQVYKSDSLWVAFDGGQEAEPMVGSGITIAIDGAHQTFDLGMVTCPRQRNKGYGSLIIAGLADRLERAGKRPICGCGPSNSASKAALEKAGFISEHRLVQFTPPPPPSGG